MPPADPSRAPDGDATDTRSLVLVLGPGRSGTSTMAGALAHSGYTVPQAIKGNVTNPSGFYEPRWVVNFHRRLLRATGVRTLDTNPTVLKRLRRVLTDRATRDELYEWLAPHIESDRRLVIKDPRLVWFRDLWADAAERIGVDPRFVIMLRHPSEVSSSRTNYYNAGELSAVGGWINVALMTEQLTAGQRRALVHYPQLTADWRTQLIRLREQLGVVLDPAPETTPHPVDEFIDPSLRRMKPGWADSAVPAHLRDLADRTFDGLGQLADQGESEQVSQRLEELRQEYAQVHADALALVRATFMRDRRDTVVRVRREVEAELAAANPSLARRVVRRARRTAARLTRRSG